MPTYAILGATGQTGIELVRLLLDDPSVHLNLYARSLAKLEKLHPALPQHKDTTTIYAGSLADPSLIASCLRGVDAVFSVLGSNVTTPDCSVGVDSSRAIITALHTLRDEHAGSASASPFACPPVIYLSSASLSPRLSSDKPRFVRWFVHQALWYIYHDMEMGIALFAEPANAFIPFIQACPGALVSAKGTGARISLDPGGPPMIAYPDLAEGIVMIAKEGTKYKDQQVGIFGLRDPDATGAELVNFAAVFVDAADGVIRGVNLGGWLVTEKWFVLRRSRRPQRWSADEMWPSRITPSLYTSTAIDEWTLCNELGRKACLSTLNSHWDSYYTRDDLVDIQKVGLNAIRIPLGYWAIDLDAYEPYVSGQFPYLIRAVNWAQELGLSVLIDVHGAPGSQNGQDNSGLIGPVLFPANSTNWDRTLNVVKNLTEEFSNEIYGGVVKGIELLNEPRVASGDFNMTYLKSFYTAGTSTLQSASTAINVTVHDAFYGPSYWSNYDPLNTTSSAPASSLTLDTHQYYAFAPLDNLPHDTILESICNVSQTLKALDSGIPSTVVGEWSLETGSAPNSTSSDQNTQDTQAKRTWFRLLFEAQLAAYEPNAPGQPSIGWYYWNWKTEYDIDTWSYRLGVAEGYIPSDVSNSSTLVFPKLSNGCVDASYNYTAPETAGAGVSGATRSHRMDVLPLTASLLIGVIGWRLL
ncbi:glucan 1,3-beta-glucosidase, partial [Tremellales sp. Uapishka_1]